MKTVVDASIAASWLLKDEQDPYSMQVGERLSRGGVMLVPSLWLLEIANILLVAQRRGRLDRGEALDALEQIKGLPLQIAPPLALPFLSQLESLAQEHGLTSYDGEYLRIAIEAEVPLATFDEALRKAAARAGVEVL